MKSSSISERIKGPLAPQEIQHLPEQNPLIRSTHTIFALTRQKISINFRAISLALNDLKQNPDLNLLELAMEMVFQKEPSDCELRIANCGFCSLHASKVSFLASCNPNEYSRCPSLRIINLPYRGKALPKIHGFSKGSVFSYI
jgi:hypothetical protein